MTKQEQAEEARMERYARRIEMVSFLLALAILAGLAWLGSHV
jgi:hypothetical protein